MDWLVRSGVNIINNSWGNKQYMETINGQINIYGYNEASYYLDFLARKYGIVSVWSAGNTRDTNISSLNSAKLAQNVVVVGSTTLSGKELSKFSEYRSPTSNIITKPLVVAPGEEYEFFSSSDIKKKLNYKERGTSFSAPLVTGLISTLFRNNNHLIGRPEAVLAILTVGSKEIDGYSEKQSNGLNEKVGAGLVNYELMQEAANNVQTLTVSDYSKNQYIHLPYLRAGQKLSVSTAWLFDAGYLKNSEYAPSIPQAPEPKPTLDERWVNMSGISISWTGGYMFTKAEEEKQKYYKAISIWNKKQKEYSDGLAKYNEYQNDHSSLNSNKYKNEWNSIEYLKKKYGSDWYIPTDIDLRIEKLDTESNSWVEIVSSVTFTSNIEFIRREIKEDGQYRIHVSQFKDNKSKQNTKGAVTYVIQ
ncbi:hypothetical protein CJJ23_00260 [Mycoplasmopsis agassizii]|uniref:Peptidase S8/S53 domain-containing protein n=1 Tax=Mycoplasmopsis agassizii TaxID=33922 RepID=A0A269TK17_9BACT|nr:S8 family serine peptidase [Mycoplasmopsis agassizii]PAK21764.1 hypothetical protein CJJ23_00260 [Mycoplasmopsis agassizii]